MNLPHATHSCAATTPSLGLQSGLQASGMRMWTMSQQTAREAAWTRAQATRVHVWAAVPEPVTEQAAVQARLDAVRK